ARPAAGSPDAVVAGAHTLPDGRELPVVRLAPKSRPAAASRTEPAPRAPSSTAEPAAAAVPSELDDTLAEPGLASQSYRLVGSRLVDLTRTNAPTEPDRPDRSAQGRAIIGEYEAAMAVYKSGQVERAETAFDRFARQYPSHDYADNALYWKGEAAYDQAHFADALAAFTDVVERYGGGNKAPDALLKIGLCYRQLGDEPNARDVLSELIAAYPGERASDIARVKLVELES
ncbi:MAG: tol-pal system protein YbgF, partial [Nannocystaceae bacterium]